VSVIKYRFPVDPIKRANGNNPSKEFYDDLDKVVKAKFNAIFIGINKSEDGYLRDDKLRKLQGKHSNNLWEMRVRYKHVWYRLLCFRDGPAWKLTHGFTKDSNETPKIEIEKGVAIKNEYYINKNQSK
jgi:phage-related protein